jgi:hypothetical protein
LEQIRTYILGVLAAVVQNQQNFDLVTRRSQQSSGIFQAA